jgi:hypothetical protein
MGQVTVSRLALLLLVSKSMQILNGAHLQTVQPRCVANAYWLLYRAGLVPLLYPWIPVV